MAKLLQSVHYGGTNCSMDVDLINETRYDNTSDVYPFIYYNPPIPIEGYESCYTSTVVPGNVTEVLASNFLFVCGMNKTQYNELLHFPMYSRPDKFPTRSVSNKLLTECTNQGGNVAMLGYNCIGYMLDIADFVSSDRFGITSRSNTTEVYDATRTLYNSYNSTGKYVKEHNAQGLWVYTKEEYKKLDNIQSGDMVLYCRSIDGSVTHGAKYVDNINGVIINSWVSKWGNGYLYSHTVENFHKDFGRRSDYGDACFFLRWENEEVGDEPVEIYDDLEDNVGAEVNVTQELDTGTREEDKKEDL